MTALGIRFLRKKSPRRSNTIKRWWEYVAKFQGVEPPYPRDEKYCDPATKTHINNDPASIMTTHSHSLSDINSMITLPENPETGSHNCNYYGNKEVGNFCGTY